MSQYEREAAIDGIKRCSGTWTREDTDAITSASRYAEINEGASIMDFLMYTQFCRTVYQQNPCDIVQKFGCDMARAFEEASHAVELCNIDHGALKGALGWFCAWYADTRPSTREDFPVSRLSKRTTWKPASASIVHSSGSHQVIGPPSPMTSTSGSPPGLPNVW